MSANNTTNAEPNGTAVKGSNSVDISDNKCDTTPRIQVTATDTVSLKSETSSACRPLKFGGQATDETSAAQTAKTDNKYSDVYNPCEVRTDGTINTVRSSRFPTLIQCQSDSTEEKTVCCTNLALNLYNKALESAKKALPKTKQRGPQFPRSFGEDFESIGPEGFNYLDDGQTECSYDYRDIEFNRDSMINPDAIAAQNLDVPIVVQNPGHEPTNLRELQARYGLPDDADRVQPYKRPNEDIIVKTKPEKVVKRTDNRLAARTEVAINRNSDSTTDVTDLTTNAADDGIIIKDKGQIVNGPPLELTNLVEVFIGGVEPFPLPNSAKNGQTNAANSPAKTEDTVKAPDSETAKNPKITAKTVNVKTADTKRAPEIAVQDCTPDDSKLNTMDLLAKRTSQMIIDDAFESIAKTRDNNNVSDDNSQYKKSSVDSSTKQLDKKEKKLLEKKLKEEEKNRKLQEKASKDMEKKERKSLFERFRSEDKQKKKILKKQKEFEKIKRKMSEKKPKADSVSKSDAEADIEADDEYEPPEPKTGLPERLQTVDKPYEDIDESQLTPEQRQTQVITITRAADGQPLTNQKPTEEVVKYEYIENIREIGVTYVPSDNDGSETTEKPKFFKIPRIESFKSKVVSILPKKLSKSGRKVEPNATKVTAEFGQTSHAGETSPTDRTSPADQSSPATVPDIVVDPGDHRPAHQYENLGMEGTAETDQNVTVSPWETEDEDRQQFIERVSRVESPKAAKKRKKSKTRVKLDRFKAKAFESLPKISTFMPKVKDLVSGGHRSKDPETRTYADPEYERFFTGNREVMRPRYDSDFDCVSDSELCDSLRRTGHHGGGLARHHVYEEMAATQERLDAYMSPVSGPLRPPRRFSSLKNCAQMSSVPTLATQELFRPRRVAPPRPPPPRPPLPRPPVVTVTVDSQARRRPKQKVPPEIYYSNLRLNYKPKRRFVNLRASQYGVRMTYDQPKPPLAVVSGVTRTQSMRRSEQQKAGVGKPVSPSAPVPKTRDVSVSTKDNGLIEMCEKQTQLDARNHSIFEPDVNGNDLEADLDTDPQTPTTPTNRPLTETAVRPELVEQCPGLNESTVTLSSTSNWYDAETPPSPVRPYADYDQDTLNDDISSIASNYMSFSSDVTVTESREETPVPEISAEPKMNASRPAVRSQSTKLATEPSGERPVNRRSLPTNVAEDDEMFALSNQLNSELKQVLENRQSSDHSSDRPESMTSSEASIHEVLKDPTEELNKRLN